MTADLKKLMQSLKAKQFAPFYLIDGEEAFYLDMISSYFEEHILQPAERDFNLITLYGKDTEWTDVVNACRRFPMFAERQVVILKDAAQMRTLNELAGYLEHPAPTTVFLIEHRFKKTDGRSKIVKLAKDKGVYFTSDKLKDEQVPQWIQNYGIESGFHVAERESQILATYLGNDLQKIVNEIEKVRINVPEEKALTAEMIQKFIGISREYNVFEMPEVLTSGDKDKLYRMVSYFSANAKSAPMPLVIGSFYSHFNRLYNGHFLRGKSDKELGQALFLFGDRLRNFKASLNTWTLPRVEYSLLILAKYSAAAVGIGSNADNQQLFREMIGRLEMIGSGNQTG
ncbi:MAG: DNA polymerase III subunit delta [Sphingobacteriales bacterium]|nr:MAG: DNA polymerase III subunit delta [Sphingobacteriales bacterium]